MRCGSEEAKRDRFGPPAGYTCDVSGSSARGGLCRARIGGWKAFRPDIEQAASALLGRKISITGDIDIALLPEPHLHAKKVVAEGGPSEAAQMSAEAVDLTLSLQGLLSGRVEASKLKLVSPFLILDLSKPLQSALPSQDWAATDGGRGNKPRNRGGPDFRLSGCWPTRSVDFNRR